MRRVTGKIPDVDFRPPCAHIHIYIRIHLHTRPRTHTHTHEWTHPEFLVQSNDVWLHPSPRPKGAHSVLVSLAAGEPLLTSVGLQKLSSVDREQGQIQCISACTRDEKPHKDRACPVGCRVLFSSLICARDTSRAQLKDSEAQRALEPLAHKACKGPGS